MSPDFTPTPEMVDAVADWQARHSGMRIQRPLVPLLRDRFDLSAVQAVAVIVAAKERKLAGGANGSS